MAGTRSLVPPDAHGATFISKASGEKVLVILVTLNKILPLGHGGGGPVSVWSVRLLALEACTLRHADCPIGGVYSVPAAKPSSVGLAKQDSGTAGATQDPGVALGAVAWKA